MTVDPAVYHALLFGLGLFYFLVSIVCLQWARRQWRAAGRPRILTGSDGGGGRVSGSHCRCPARS